MAAPAIVLHLGPLDRSRSAAVAPSASSTCGVASERPVQSFGPVARPAGAAAQCARAITPSCAFPRGSACAPVSHADGATSPRTGPGAITSLRGPMRPPGRQRALRCFHAARPLAGSPSPRGRRPPSRPSRRANLRPFPGATCSRPKASHGLEIRSCASPLGYRAVRKRRPRWWRSFAVGPRRRRRTRAPPLRPPPAAAGATTSLNAGEQGLR